MFDDYNDYVYTYSAKTLMDWISDIRGRHYSVVLNTVAIIRDEIDVSYYDGKITQQQKNELLEYLQETVEIYGSVED